MRLPFRRTSVDNRAGKSRRPRPLAIAVQSWGLLRGETLEERWLLSLQPVSSPPLGNDDSDTLFSRHAVSIDGRFVVFNSAANNLVPNDTNNETDVFWRDLQTGEIALVSVGLDGPANGESRKASLSNDGRYVAFESTASNLVASGGVGSQVYVRDMVSQVTVLASPAASFEDAHAYDAAISGDGRFVAFTGRHAITLEDQDDWPDIYVSDWKTGTIVLASVSEANLFGFDAYDSSISYDGRFVSFTSTANDSDVPSADRHYRAYVRDLVLGTTRVVSVGLDGSAASGYYSSISNDGRFVAFEGGGNNLFASDTNNSEDVFVRDLQANVTLLVSARHGVQGKRGSGHPSISGDGRYVSFTSVSSDLTDDPPFAQQKIYRRDMTTGDVRLVSGDETGPIGSNSIYASISGDGQHVVFTADSFPAFEGDTNASSDVMLWTDEHDYAPPTVSSTSFSATGIVSLGATALTVTFSEAVYRLDSFTSAEIHSFGPDGLAGTADDRDVQVYAEMASNLTAASIGFDPLVPGLYQLRVSDLLADHEGNRLDGNADGDSLGDYVANFIVPAQPGTVGWLDGSFGIGGHTPDVFPGIAQAIAVQADQKIVVAGTPLVGQWQDGFVVARYNPDGSLDTGFGLNGKFVTSVGVSTSHANAIALQSDGKIIVGGSAAHALTGAGSGELDVALLRLNSNGSRDATFGTNGVALVTPRDPYGAYTLCVQPDGKILAAGAGILRFNSNGRLDTTFGQQGMVYLSYLAKSLALQSNGQIVVAGEYSKNGHYDFVVSRFNSNGVYDTTFGGNGQVVTSIAPGDDKAAATIVQPDGKIVVAGYAYVNAKYSFVLVRYNVDGTLDSTFGAAGIQLTPEVEDGLATSVVLQPDGNILAAGYASSNAILVRYLSNGSLDPAFGGAGVVRTPSRRFNTAVQVQADGKLVTADAVWIGGYGNFGVSRYNSRLFAQPVGQYPYYNHSTFDDRQTQASLLDFAAVAVAKRALLPGGVANAENYTSFDRGITGIALDFTGLSGTALSPSDFQFRIGNDSDPNHWAVAPPPTGIFVREGAGKDSSARVLLTWPDNAIKNQWLQVTVLATSATGLLQPRVYYFGNAVGDTGADPRHANVNATDEIGARNHVTTPQEPAAIDNVYDFNRDGLVNATDQMIARSNATTLATALKLITVPGNLAALSSAAPLLRSDDEITALHEAIALEPAAPAPLRPKNTTTSISAAPAAWESFDAAVLGVEASVPPAIQAATAVDRAVSRQIADQQCDADDELFDAIADDLLASRE